MTIKEMVERYPEVRIVQEVINQHFPGWELVSPTCPGRQGYETWAIKLGEENAKIISVHLSTRTILDEGELRGKKKPKGTDGDDAGVCGP